MKCAKVLILVAMGPAVASAGNPAWCKKVEGGFSGDSAKHVRDPDLTAAARAAISESCKAENEAYGSGQKALHADVDKARAELSAKLGMVEADWADGVAWEDNRSSSIELSAKTLDALTPIDQYAAMTGDWKSDPVFTADALEPKLTETGRLGLLKWCVKQSAVTHESDPLLSWAVCAYDVEHFDVKKLYGELKSDTAHPANVRFAVRLVAAQMATEQLPKLLADEKKLFAKDASYKKPFDDTLKARDEWQKTVGANAKLLALAGKMDGGVWFHSRSAMEGCEAETAAALAAAVSKIPAKSFANMFDALDHKHPGLSWPAHGGAHHVPADRLQVR